MIDPRHRLHSFLPETVNQIRQRQTRSNGENCIILDIELNDLKIAQLCIGLNVLTERWSRSKFIEFFQKFLFKITCKYTFNISLS